MYFLNPISDIKIACTYSLRFASVRLVLRFNPRMANGYRVAKIGRFPV